MRPVAQVGQTAAAQILDLIGDEVASLAILLDGHSHDLLRSEPAVRQGDEGPRHLEGMTGSPSTADNSESHYRGDGGITAAAPHVCVECNRESGMRQIWDGTSIEWGSAEVERGVRIHYGVAGTGDRTVMLVHGYPQTAYAWRRVVPLLVRAGLCVVMPDYRGAGGSSKPLGGYDKHTMAGDLHALLYGHLGLTGPVSVIGHDIGMMVAYAFARRFPERTERLVVMEAPLAPATGVMADMGGNATFCFWAGKARKPTALAVSPALLTSTNAQHLSGENRRLRHAQ